jgi:hypothetical protein
LNRKIIDNNIKKMINLKSKFLLIKIEWKSWLIQPHTFSNKLKKYLKNIHPRFKHLLKLY